MFLVSEFYPLNLEYPCPIVYPTKKGDELTFPSAMSLFCAFMDPANISLYQKMNGREARLFLSQSFQIDNTPETLDMLRQTIKLKLSQHPSILDILTGIPFPVTDENLEGETILGKCFGQGIDMHGQILEEFRTLLPAKHTMPSGTINTPIQPIPKLDKNSIQNPFSNQNASNPFSSNFTKNPFLNQPSMSLSQKFWNA